ncbi:MAG: DoxX family protein [Actinomycetia bacterium]|nr:DoxX family protein [Actinomycetes bacterium]
MEAYDYAALLLRLAVGGIMLAHGIKHARGKEKTSRWFGSIGFKSPTMQWFASTATEIGVGVLLIAGFLTAAAAAGVIGVMTVAFFSVHRSVGFWVTARPDEGWEYIMLIAATSAAIAIGGPGEISVDHALGIATDFNGWIGAGIALAGVGVALVQLAIFFRPPEPSNS